MLHYRGKVFRPPFEENSLLIEATVGCSRDKCAFCSIYHDTPFAPSPMEDIESDIRFIGRNRTLFKRVFLVGADPFCLPFNRLQRIGELVGEQLPRVETIGCYASVRNILAKTPEQLSELAKLGYARLNIGLETGLDDVLAFMDKGNTADEAREALARLNEAGIPFTLNLVMGLAGAGRGIENAIASAEAFSKAAPTTVLIVCLAPVKTWPLAKDIESGRWVAPTEAEMAQEIRAFVEHLDCKTTVNCSHDSDVIRFEGGLPADKEKMLALLDDRIPKIDERYARMMREMIHGGSLGKGATA